MYAPFCGQPDLPGWPSSCKSAFVLRALGAALLGDLHLARLRHLFSFHFAERNLGSNRELVESGLHYAGAVEVNFPSLCGADKAEALLSHQPGDLTADHFGVMLGGLKPFARILDELALHRFEGFAYRDRQAFAIAMAGGQLLAWHDQSDANIEGATLAVVVNRRLDPHPAADNIGAEAVELGGALLDFSLDCFSQMEIRP